MPATRVESPTSRLPDPDRLPWISRPWLLGLLIFTTLAVTHRSLLFVQPWHEHSDLAVGALNIERARHFQTFLGNCSRFGFSHPGPAFEYVYAFGEQLFYRTLGLVPSPHNAHLLAGLLLQSFFFTAALAVVKHWIRAPFFLPLVLLTSAIHLSLAGNAFVSVWQPHALLMPFFCFVVGAASLASGYLRHLPITVLAACFLVHGHVGQPLFVLPIFLLACASAWRRSTASQSHPLAPLQTHRVALLVSLACIALFLLPLAIDLAAGARSNLARIFEFQASYDSPGKPLWRSLLYFCAFFGYVKHPESFLSVPWPDRAAALGEHVAGYFIWAALIGLAFAYAWRLRLRSDRPERPFVLALTAFTALAFLLSLYWGTLQVGRMYQYNGYFFYAILSCLLLLLACAAAPWTPRRPRLVTAVLCGAALLVTWQCPSASPALDYSTNDIPPAVRHALASDPLPSAPKYLVFDHADWGEAASIALALQRIGPGFRADLDWGPKFAPGAGVEPTPPDFNLHGLSTWRLSRRGPPDLGLPLRDNLRVYFDPLPLDPTHAVIDAGEGGTLELYKFFGFNSPVSSASWTIRPCAGLVFASPPVSSDVSVTFVATPFALPDQPAAQPMSLLVNGRVVFSTVLTQRGSVTARIPAEIWNAQKSVTLVLHLPAAVAPPGPVRVSTPELGGSLDERMFGWRIERITFETAP